MEFLLPGMVLAVVIASVVAWLRIAGGDEGVAESELVDVTEPGKVPHHFDAQGRHAVATVASRRTPLVFVRRGAHFGEAWLHFADGTELLAQELRPGALGLLAIELLWRGPTTAFTIAATGQDCWATVGRHATRVLLVDAHHPEALAES